MCEAILKGCIYKNKTELVGHSLGAQVAAAAGKAFIALCKTKLKRITGLDPAGPGFDIPMASLLLCGSYLNHELADWVNIIHSDRGNYGTSLICGTLDIILNCGCRNQPGCAPFTSLLQQSPQST